MERRLLLIILIVAAVLIVFFWPKVYAHSGGFAGFPKSAECSCLGFEYNYYPEGCFDCFTTYYCAGLPYDCKSIGP